VEFRFVYSAQNQHFIIFGAGMKKCFIYIYNSFFTMYFRGQFIRGHWQQKI